MRSMDQRGDIGSLRPVAYFERIVCLECQHVNWAIHYHPGTKIAANGTCSGTLRDARIGFDESGFPGGCWRGPHLLLDGCAFLGATALRQRDAAVPGASRGSDSHKGVPRSCLTRTDHRVVNPGAAEAAQAGWTTIGGEMLLGPHLVFMGGNAPAICKQDSSLMHVGSSPSVHGR
jgi:hypothetical protein